MKKNRKADDIYDIRAVYGNFKGKKLHADISAPRATRLKISMKFLEGILTYPNMRAIAFLFMFLGHDTGIRFW